MEKKVIIILSDSDFCKYLGSLKKETEVIDLTKNPELLHSYSQIKEERLAHFQELEQKFRNGC